ncbi:YadA-like family protein [Proteus vulgaris]|uniref:YadA-like family protein n=1 Tax=Proteus vulgaris TaxID=585 RepID=UPI002575A3B9|nr:YadA-like family protein [Proteus vulgaris]MDM3560499.1 YadA-like family protein [Proteus vulgaris]
MRYNKLFIISFSLIYSSTVFSNTIEIKKSTQDTIIPEFQPSVSTPHFLKKPVADKIISNSYVWIDNDQNYSYLRIDKPLLSELASYLQNRGLTNEANKIQDKLIKIPNGYIQINASDKKVRDVITDFFSFRHNPDSEYSNFSMNRDSVLSIMQGNKNILLERTPQSGIKLDKLREDGADLAEDIAEFNINTDKYKPRNSTIMVLSQHIEREITKLEQADGMLNNSIRDLKERTNEEFNDLNQKTNKNKNSIQENNEKITKNTNDIAKHDEKITQNINSIITHEDAIKKNKADISENKNHITKNRDNINYNASIIDGIKENIIDNININNVKLPLKNHLSHLYNEQSTNRSQFNALKNNFEQFKSDTQNRFYKVEKRANQGIASVAAMSNLPFTDSATFSTAIGIGNYRNATALAWGMQYRINENIKVRASTAWNESNWVSAGGVGVSW